MKKIFIVFVLVVVLAINVNAAADNSLIDEENNSLSDSEWIQPFLDYGVQLEEDAPNNNIFDNVWDGFLSKIIRSAYTRLIEVLMFGMNSVMSQAGSFLQLDIVKEALHFSTALAVSLLIPKVLIEIINTYFLFRAGDPDADIKNLVIRIVVACFVVAASASLYQIMYNFGVSLGNDVAILVSVGRTSTAGGLQTTIGATSMLVLVYVIILVMVYFQMLVRGAEMAVYKVLMPLFALNLTSVNQGFFGSFLRQSLVACLSQVLQLLLFKMCMSVFMVDSAGSLMMGIAFAWITFKSPKILKELMYSSGLGQSVGAVTRTVTSAATHAIMRRL